MQNSKGTLLDTRKCFKNAVIILATACEECRHSDFVAQYGKVPVQRQLRKMSAKKPLKMGKFALWNLQIVCYLIAQTNLNIL